MFIMFYESEIPLFGCNEQSISQVIKKLNKKFDLKILDETKHLLKVQFEEINGNLTIYQTNYINKIQKNFEKFRPAITSLSISKSIILLKLQCRYTKNEIVKMEKLPYRS